MPAWNAHLARVWGIKFLMKANPLLRQLKGFTTSPPGLEQRILRRIPELLVLGLAAITAPTLLIRVLPYSGSIQEWQSAIAMIDIVAIAFGVFYITMLFTLGLGAFIVKLMKGPAYVADSYPLIDSDQPK